MTHLIPTYLLTPLRETTSDRRHRAEAGLADGSLTITPTRHTETELRALVKNGDGKEYGVVLTEGHAFCSCPDALYRGVTCKHAIAVCLTSLHQYDPIEDRVHLMWSSGEILCGIASAHRLWRNWSLNALNWSDLVCSACVHAWIHPAIAEGRRREAPQAECPCGADGPHCDWHTQRFVMCRCGRDFLFSQQPH